VTFSLSISHTHTGDALPHPRCCPSASASCYTSRAGSWLPWQGKEALAPGTCFVLKEIVNMSYWFLKKHELLLY
jgi:hypothetical protein